MRKLVSTLGLFFFASVSSACNSGDELTSPLHARTSLALPVTTRTAQDETARSIGLPTMPIFLAPTVSNEQTQLICAQLALGICGAGWTRDVLLYAIDLRDGDLANVV